MSVTRKLGRAACGVLALLALLSAGAVDAAEKWGPFRGQFIDVETGQPIPGAVVLVAWYEAVFALVQTNQRFYDAREAVAGPDGRFEVPRLSPPLFSFRILDPQISYFAPGYIPTGERVTPQDGQPFVARTVVEMRSVRTREEQRGILAVAVPHLPWELRFEKMPRYLQALNEARQRAGLKPYPGP